MSEKCDAGCKPINAYYHGKQLVESLYDGLYPAKQAHLPCGLPGCEASRLVHDLPPEPKPLKPKPQLLTGDADLDRLEAELRARLRAHGLDF